MPLSHYQRESIKSIIHHLFELPSEEKALRQFVDDVKQAWLKNLPRDHDLAGLQNCIHQPTQNLRYIENNNRDITIGEVLRYLFNFSRRSLVTATKKLGMQRKDLQFEAKFFLQPLLEKFKGPFETERLDASRYITVRPDHEPHTFEPEGRIYKSVLIADKESNKAKLTITLQVLPLVRHTIDLADLPNRRGYYYYGSYSYEYFLSTLTSDAESTTKTEAKKLILKSLGLDHVNMSESAKTLLTYSFFYHGTRLNHIPLQLICNINAFQLETLTMMMDFIQQKAFSIPVLLKVTSPERNLMRNPFYFSELQNGRLQYHRDVEGITETEYSNLILPVSIFLLRENKIKIQQAKSMSAGARKILWNEFYSNLIKKGLMDFSVIQHATETFADDLNNPAMMYLISGNKINPNDLTPQLARLLVNDNFIRYCTRTILPSIIKFIKQDLLDKDTLETVCQSLPEGRKTKRAENIFEYDSLLEIGNSNAKKRLQALLLEQPLTLSDGSLDNFKKLKRNCEICRVNFEEILDEEIDERMRSSSSANLDNMASVIANQTVLELSDLHLKELHFGKRLMEHFERVYITDYTGLKKEIIETATEEKLPDLYNAVIRRFLQLLRAKLREKIIMDDENDFYKNLVREVDRAEKMALEEKEETAQLECWRNAFFEMVSMAGTQKWLLNAEGYLTFNTQRYIKRQCISSDFFLRGSEPLDLFNAKHVCDGLIKIADEMRFDLTQTRRPN